MYKERESKSDMLILHLYISVYTTVRVVRSLVFRFGH